MSEIRREWDRVASPVPVDIPTLTNAVLRDSKRCGACAFWKRGEEGDSWDDKVNIAELAVRDSVTHEKVDPQPFELRYCRSPKLRRYERPEIDGATSVDGSEWWSALVTGPHYGCIHFTEKP